MKTLRCSCLLLLFIVFLAAVSLSTTIDLLDSINNESSELFLEVRTDKNQNIAFVGDNIVFYIAADIIEKKKTEELKLDCYVILLMVTPSGDFKVLFPNKSHPGFQITKRLKYQIPGAGMDKITVSGPAGFGRLKAIATKDSEFFLKFPELSVNQDFVYIKSPEDFLKKLKKELKNLPKDSWCTTSLEFSIEGNDLYSPTGNPTPYVDPEITSLLDDKYVVTKYYMQGSAYYEENKYDEAIEQFKKVIELSPNLAYAYYSLGLSYQCKGAFKEAISYYKKCIDHSVKVRDCYIRLGEMSDLSGKKDEACTRYKKALSITEGYEKIKSMPADDTSNKRLYDLEVKCNKEGSDKKSRMELALIYEKLKKYKAAGYHMKVLLKQAVPLYEPYNLAEDKPALPEKPADPVPPVAEDYYYTPSVESYTYVQPITTTYKPEPVTPQISGNAPVLFDDK